MKNDISITSRRGREKYIIPQKNCWIDVGCLFSLSGRICFFPQQKQSLYFPHLGKKAFKTAFKTSPSGTVFFCPFLCVTSIAFGSNEGVLSTSAMLLPPTTQPAATPTRLLNYLINLFRGRTTELFTGNLKQLAGPREQPFILSTQKLRSKRC